VNLHRRLSRDFGRHFLGEAFLVARVEDFAADFEVVLMTSRATSSSGRRAFWFSRERQPHAPWSRSARLRRSRAAIPVLQGFRGGTRLFDHLARGFVGGVDDLFRLLLRGGELLFLLLRVL
jgi:hypothetical protein